MKKFFWILVAIIVMLPTSLFAAEPSEEQLRRLAKATGIYEQIEEQKIAINNQSEQTAQQYARQIMSSMPELPSEYAEYVKRELEVYLSKIADLIDTEFAVNAYMRLIGEKLSSKEVEELVDFYESDLGKKFVKVNTDIMKPWTNEFLGDIDKKLMVHLQAFIDNLISKASSLSESQSE